MKSTLIVFIFLFLLIIVGCKKDKNQVDTEYPSIDILSTEAFPKQCSEITKGGTVTARIRVADNAELGSVSIDIHHNFDQHSHSTEINDCSMDDKKSPVNPMLLIKSIPIPDGNTAYTVIQEIDVPADIDTGDYHFLIRVTDKEGWQTLKGLSIKIK